MTSHIDILSGLNAGDSFCKTAMSRRENVPGGVDVAVVYRAASAATQTCSIGLFCSPGGGSVQLAK